MQSYIKLYIFYKKQDFFLQEYCRDFRPHCCSLVLTRYNKPSLQAGVRKYLYIYTIDIKSLKSVKIDSFNNFLGFFG